MTCIWLIWQTTQAPEGTIVTRCFKLSPEKIHNLMKIWHPMSKKVQHGTSGATIYHRVTQFYHRVPQFFIGLCNFSTRLQIPRGPIWYTGLTYFLIFFYKTQLVVFYVTRHTYIYLLIYRMKSSEDVNESKQNILWLKHRWFKYRLPGLEEG